MNYGEPSEDAIDYVYTGDHESLEGDLVTLVGICLSFEEIVFSLRSTEPMPRAFSEITTIKFARGEVPVW